MRSRCSPDREQKGKDTFFFDFGGRFLNRWCSIQPCAFSLRHLQLSWRPGNLFYLFTPVKSMPKSPHGVANLGLQTCMQPDVLQHTPASTTCMLIYANHRVGDFYCRFEVRTNATAIVTLVKRIIFLLFWERRRDRQRALRDLTCSFGGLVATIDEAYQCMAVKAAVRCLLLTANAADNKHHALAKSPSIFETNTQKTDRRHPTPFPNTNEVECMPATSLHDLLQ